MRLRPVQLSWLPAPLALLVGLLASGSAIADLHQYVSRPEPAYAWKLKEKKESDQGTVYDLHLVSQVWQGITWEHQLQVYQPMGTEPKATMLLWNTGGGGNDRNQLFGMELARRVQAPVAFLYHIPNQPLLDGKKEDALIAETFNRYLKSKDENWPLLFPMVKSVIKSMDALEAFSKQEWKQPVNQFIISGASKRGWTSWLTGATADPRVKAIAPLVIDTLNMRAQMPHQLETLGKYSDMIADYTSSGLVPMPSTPEAKRLWGMVDPWVYREKLTMPKLIVNGCNDPYWSTDALNLYWDDLLGDKWITYVPNAGHDLRQKDRPLLAQADQAINAVAAFARHQIKDNPMPKIQWRHEDQNGKSRVVVKASETPTAARIWVARSPTRDFRKAEWVAEPARIVDGAVVGEVAPPATGYLAYFAELDQEIDGLKYQLSTQMRVVAASEKVKAK